MVKSRYMQNILGTYLTLTLFAVLLVGGLQFLIIMLVVTANFLDLIYSFYRQLPPLAQQFFGEEFIGQFTLTGAAAFGYNHPLVLTVLMLVAIAVPSRFIAGEIESGSMEVLLALPVRRSVLFLALLISVMIMLFTVVSGGWCGTFLAKGLFPQAGEIPAGRIVQIGLNLWLLSLCVSAYTLLIAAFHREHGRAAILSAIITVGLFLVNYITKIWDAIEFLEPLNLTSYYSTQEIMADPGIFYRNAAVLAALTLVFSAVGFFQFIRRDIPG